MAMKTKQIYRLIYIVTIVIVLLSNCKKGKEDPFLLLGAGLLLNQTYPESIVSAKAFLIGGTITGLDSSELILSNNEADELKLASGDTRFTFATKVSGAYDVRVKTQPTGLTCSVSSGSGTAIADVTSVVVSCAKSCPKTIVTRNWGTFTDQCDGTIQFVGNAGTFGGQTYTAQTLYFAKCTHGQTYNSSTNDCTETGNLGDNYGGIQVQYCSMINDRCNSDQGVLNGSTLEVSGAYNACNALSLVGKSWRVPTKNELKLLINCTNAIELPDDGTTCTASTSPTVIPVFTNTISSPYWSSNSLDGVTAWFINFNNSITDNLDKNSNYYVRCVSGP